MEGDGVHRVARRLSALAGARVVHGVLRHTPRRLDGWVLAATEAHGKHLLTRFEDLPRCCSWAGGCCGTAASTAPA